MVLDPPPPFLAVFEMLEDPGRWRQGLDNLLAGWLAGAPEDVAGWTRRETGSYGFDMWSRAARAVTADYGQYGSPLRSAMELDQKPFLLPMPDEAAVALARALHERGEEVLGLNGALPAVDLCAAELTRLGGGRVQVSQHTRLHELGELVWPPPVPGGLQAATEDDVDLVMEWFGAFMGDADEQAGRPRGASAHDVPDRAEMLRRLRAGGLWFWVTGAGERVHLTGVSPPSFGVAPRGPGVHAAGPARVRLGQQRRRRDFSADPGQGRAGVPVHRPGQPDLEQDLHRPRLPASSRHGQPCHRPLTPTDSRQKRIFTPSVTMYKYTSWTTIYWAKPGLLSGWPAP